MNYIKVEFTVQPAEPFRDMLMANLADEGFESFEETDRGLVAYIPEAAYHRERIDDLEVMQIDLVSITYQLEVIPEQNWNATWEADFQPIEVNENCRVRAPFHAAQNLKYEITIAPKMSFGTGHHETTFLMLKQMLNIDLSEKSVLDMGTGTGVLAILAAKMKAADVLAIDVDAWAYENALENVSLNQPVDIAVEKGGADQINGRTFQVILANINKNVLLQDLPLYAKSLRSDGKLLLSGFFVSDIEDLVTRAESCGFTRIGQSSKNSWAVLELQKK